MDLLSLDKGMCRMDINKELPKDLIGMPYTDNTEKELLHNLRCQTIHTGCPKYTIGLLLSGQYALLWTPR